LSVDRLRSLVCPSVLTWAFLGPLHSQAFLSAMTQVFLSAMTQVFPEPLSSPVCLSAMNQAFLGLLCFPVGLSAPLQVFFRMLSFLVVRLFVLWLADLRCWTHP